MKFKVFLDSGANAFSCREQEVTLDELNITEEEWFSMSEDEKDEIMRDIAWNRMDWGYYEIDVF